MKKFYSIWMHLFFANGRRTARGKIGPLLLLGQLAAFFCAAQSATITVDAGASLGTLFRSEAYNNVSGVNTGAATRDVDYAFMNSQGLHSKVLRIWVSDGLYDAATDTYNYGPYDSYLSSVSSLMADEILMCIPGNTLIDTRNYTPAQCKPVIKNIIRRFKGLYPKIKYVEALNEPDLYANGTTITPANAYSYYKIFYEAVNEINAELSPAVPLQVGGLAISSFKYAGTQWIRPFLDGYRDDPSPDKKLDFLSYHTYSYKDSPKETGNIRPTIETWLSSRGLPTTIPTFVTETGLFPGSATSGTEEDDALRQAAGMAAYVYWEIGSPYNIPFNWVMRHASDVRKDQIVTRPVSYSDRLTPYGNSMKMFSMMKAQRITATTNVMDANGLGVYGLASTDATGLSLLVWNYQHTSLQDYYTKVDISNLPAIFTGSAIRKKVYRIDQSTSNNYYNVANCNLQLVSDTVLANPGTTLSLSLGILKENNLQLVILEPAADPAPNTFGLVAARQANGFRLSWNTTTEANSVYFEVLRSADGTTFSRIAYPAAAGSSATPQAYNFTDAAPVPGINYYQVKLVGADSSRTASRIVTAFISPQGDVSNDIYYSFGATGSESGNPTSGVPAGWTAGVVGRYNAAASGSIFTSTSPSNNYTGASGLGNATMGALQGSLNGRTVTYGTTTTTIPVKPISALSYYEVTLTPAASDAVKITNIRFGSRSIGSSGGPANVVIRTSVGNYASNAFAQDVNAASTWVFVNAQLASPITAVAGVPVTIRFYANDAVGTTINANNWRIDDLYFTVDVPRPVAQLHTFTATETSTHGTQLSWQTTTEQNVANFDVLRSVDGVTFTAIGQVAAAGNSSVNRQYGFVDPSPYSGINYYQLREVFTNASTTLSDVQAVYIAQGATANLYYSFGATGSENGNPTAGVPDGWIASPVTIANSPRVDAFFTSTSNTGTYSGASQGGNAVLIANAGSLNGRTVTYGSTTTTISAGSLSALSYFELTLTPSAGQAVQIMKMTFGSRSIGSSGGPANVVIRTSLDNFSSNAFAQDLNANSAWEIVTAVFAQALAGAADQNVTIRFYANDAVGSTTLNNWRIDDLNILVSLQTNTTLPVRLTSFTAAAEEHAVRLKWHTEWERGNSGFVVERSADGRSYAALGRVSAQTGFSSAADYSFVDQAPLDGTSYYRLQQLDNTGQAHVFGPVRVSRHAATEIERVWTTGNSLQLSVQCAKAAPVSLTVIDMAGRQLAVRQAALVAGANLLSLPVALPSGVYVVQVSGDGIMLSKKFLK